MHSIGASVRQGVYMVKGYVLEKKQVPGSLLDYYKCLSGLQRFNPKTTGGKIYVPFDIAQGKPADGRVVIEQNANIPMKVRPA